MTFRVYTGRELAEAWGVDENYEPFPWWYKLLMELEEPISLLADLRCMHPGYNGVIQLS